MTDDTKRDALRDSRVPVPRFTIGDRARFTTGEKWIEDEAPMGVVTEVKLRMFRQGPDYWTIQYDISFDKPWPDNPLSGSKIRSLKVPEYHLKRPTHD